MYLLMLSKTVHAGNRFGIPGHEAKQMDANCKDGLAMGAFSFSVRITILLVFVPFQM